jgi:hypothetical protein
MEKTVKIRYEHSKGLVIDEFNNQNLSPTQIKFLERTDKNYEIIKAWITRGGYLQVNFKRHSRDFPYGMTCINRRGGIEEQELSKYYDPECDLLYNVNY